MSPRERVGACVLLALAVGGCQQKAAERPLGAPFEIAAGQIVHLTGTDLRLRFVRVEADSRCPAGVQCITAGEAVIALEAKVGGTNDVAHLHLGGGSLDGGPPVQVAGIEVRLHALVPAPVAGAVPDTTAYVATLVASR
jgi:hypothetical protein